MATRTRSEPEVHFSLPNTPELARLGAAEWARFLESNPPAEPARFAVDHALTEHLQNVADHSGAREVDVTLGVGGGVVRVTVSDDGTPFDPLDAPEPPLDLPPDERPVGGLGVHMMRRLMDGLRYERRGDRNVLEMTKRLGGR